MADAMYVKGVEGIMDGSIDLDSDDIRVILVDGDDYTPNLATHEFLSSVASGARVATSGALQSKSVTGGVFDADDIVIESVTGDEVEYILIYQHTGNDNTARLIYLNDSATGLPLTPNGGDVTVSWDDGASKIFKFPTS